MIKSLEPHPITSSRPSRAFAAPRTFWVLLIGLLIVQAVTLLFVLVDQNERLDNPSQIVEDCAPGPDSPPTFSRHPTGKCIPLPIRLPVKV